MNILILAPQPFFQQRGTPIAVKMLAEVLAAMGHSVDLLVYQEGEDVTMPGVTLHRIPRIPFVHKVAPGPSWKKFPCDAFMLFCAWRIMSRKKIDLIHAVEESAFAAIVLKMLRGVPYVYDMDSSLAEQTVDKWKLPRFAARFLEKMEQMAVRQSVGVLAVCRALEEKARTYAPDKLIQRLEDVTLLNPIESGPVLRDQLGIQGPIVMYVGNLESYQGIDLLLESFVLTRQRSPEAHLVVIGGTADTVEHYRRRAAALDISQNTHFTGPRPVAHLDWYLRQADVLVSPRTQGQNTPMKLYSYLDSGKAVLATRLPTHTQVLDDEIASLAEPIPADMAEHLVRLISDPTMRRALGQRAQQRVAQEYSPEAFRSKAAAFYNAIASSSAVKASPLVAAAELPGSPRQ